jgi:hypothetical protein
MAEKKTDYSPSTFRQELLQCVALAYFIKNSGTTNEDFFNYLENFSDDKDPESILSIVYVDCDIKGDLGIYHNTSPAANTWVKSSIDIARFLISKLNLNSNYEIYHHKSKFGKLIKDDCLTKIATKLNSKIISSKPDVYNPTDIWIIEKNSKTDIENELKKYIIDKDVNIVGNYSANENTYRTIIEKYYIKKKIYQISLKKSKTANNIINSEYLASKNKLTGIGFKIIGMNANADRRIEDIDPYTKFLLAFDQVLNEGNETKIMKFIEDLVKINKLNYKDEVLQPNLIFELNYNNVKIPHSEIEKWKLDTPGNTFNMQKIGGTSWSGGLNTNGVHHILTNYPKYNKIFSNLKAIRLNSYKEIQTDPSSIVTNILNKSEIVYKQSDLKKIKDDLGNTLYLYFLARSIENISKPFRGIKVLYGITDAETLALTRKEPTGEIIIVDGKEKIVKEFIENTKKTQHQIRLQIKQCKKGDTVIFYEDHDDAKKGIKQKFYAFFVSANGTVENGTRIEKVDLSQNKITLSKPIKSGGKNLTLLVMDGYASNIVTNTALKKLKGADKQKNITYLEQKYSKLQAFYMFMQGGPELLNEVLKKQIVLTIYGLVSKKGGKLFDPSLTKVVKGRVFAKNALKDFLIAPFMIVGD